MQIYLSTLAWQQLSHPDGVCEVTEHSSRLEIGVFDNASYSMHATISN